MHRLLPAILAACGLVMACLAPAEAQQDDLAAISDRFEKHYAARNYSAALIEAQKFEAGIKGKFGADHVNYASALSNLAIVYHAQGKFADAEAYYQRTLTIREGKLGRDHLDVAQTLNNLAVLYQAEGKLDRAETHHRRAFAIREAKLGRDHPDVADSLNNLAIVYRAMGKSADAEAHYRRALAIREVKLGRDHPDVAQTLNNLAVLYQAQGKAAEAEAHYQRALAIREAKLGQDHPSVADTLYNLGILYRAWGKPEQAEAHYRRALAIREVKLGRDHLDVANTLYNLALVYQENGKYAQAEAHYLRELPIIEAKLGRDHPHVAETLNNLGNLYRAQGKPAQAETHYQRALAIREAKLGRDHSSVADPLYSLAVIYEAQGKFAQAEAHYQRALAIRDAKLGQSHPDTGQVHTNLAILYQTQGKFAQAEAHFQRALAIREVKLGTDHPELADIVYDLGVVSHAQGKSAQAQTHYRRALAMLEAKFGRNHPELAQPLNNLAVAYQMQGNYAQAETHYQRALAIREARLGRDHPEVANTLNNLANLYQAQGKSAQAQSHYQRTLAILEAKLGHNHPDVAKTLNNLAAAFQAQGKSAQAATYYQRTLAILEPNLGHDHPDVAYALNNLGIVSQAQGQFAQAEAHYQRALAIRETRLGRDQFLVASTLNNLGTLDQAQGKYAQAEARYQRVLAIREAKLGSDHPEVASALNNLAIAYHLQGKLKEALVSARRASLAVIGHATTEAGTSRQGSDSAGMVTQRADYFRRHVTILHNAASGRIEPEAALARESFEIAQWAGQSAAAAALAQMAARQANGAGPLSELVRERQDLERQWQVFDRRLTEAVSKGDVTASAALRSELSGLTEKFAAIDARLARDFPEYAALARPKPLSIATTQSLLGADEALFLAIDAVDESFGWLVTRTDARWVKLALTPGDIAHAVQTLRCGLDRDGEWQLTGGQRWKARKEACNALAPNGFAADELPPFDPAAAHALYESLFGPFTDMVRGKHLMIVATGALASLPFQTLVTEKPADPSTIDHAAVPWLGTRHALTVLPSVASLKALREHAKGGAAGKPYAGVGNPLLLGASGADTSASRKQACAARPAARAKVAARAGLGADAGKVAAGGRVDLALLRRQEPLPETADEICDVGRSLAAAPADILLGAKATERAVKSLSASGALANYRVLHFATHGLLPHETASLAADLTEAALLLTPPNEATEEDDGLLTASEITLLKLNADWVIMSACNTGGGDRSGEALSGLARAFFYAGARALLVSHWYVDSTAAVALTTRTFDEMKRDPKLGRAAALRRSMQALIARGGPSAHPSQWAPFVVVGEGAAR